MSSAAVSRPVIGCGEIGSPERNRDRDPLLCACSAASRASAARFCSAFGPAADARLDDPCRDGLKPPRALSPPFFFFPPPPRPSDFFMDLYRLSLDRGLDLRVVRRNDRARRLRRVVGDEDEIHVARGDLL